MLKKLQEIQNVQQGATPTSGPPAQQGVIPYRTQVLTGPPAQSQGHSQFQQHNQVQGPPQSQPQSQLQPQSQPQSQLQPQSQPQGPSQLQPQNLPQNQLQGPPQLQQSSSQNQLQDPPQQNSLQNQIQEIPQHQSTNVSPYYSSVPAHSQYNYQQQYSQQFQRPTHFEHSQFQQYSSQFQQSPPWYQNEFQKSGPSQQQFNGQPQQQFNGQSQQQFNGQPQQQFNGQHQQQFNGQPQQQFNGQPQQQFNGQPQQQFNGQPQQFNGQPQQQLNGQLQQQFSNSSKQQEFNSQSKQQSQQDLNIPSSQQDKYQLMLKVLARYNILGVLDDSGSMELDGIKKGVSRWMEALEAIDMLMKLATQYDDDGVDVFFLNEEEKFNIGRNDSILDKISQKKIVPRGGTPLGGKLLSIFEDFKKLYHVYKSKGNLGELKPINVIIITDGEPSDKPNVLQAIVDICQFFEDQGTDVTEYVGLQFFQVGKDESAKKYLEDLDDNIKMTCKLRSGKQVSDIVDSTCFNPDNPVPVKFIMTKALLGGINTSMDNDNSHAAQAAAQGSYWGSSISWS